MTPSIKLITEPRVFHKLNIAYNSYKYHSFFLEQMAYWQWNNKAPHISGPAMLLERSIDQYDYWKFASEIACCLQYYMKPYNIQVFGHNIKYDKEYSLLIRVFLNMTKEYNNALVLMENVGEYKPNNLIVNEYMRALNNRSWQPNNWDKITSISRIEQTLHSTDKPYPGSWIVDMKLE